MHRRSQDFLWGALFFPEKGDDFCFSRRPQKEAKITKLTTFAVQISPISSKNWTFALPRGALATFPSKFGPK